VLAGCSGGPRTTDVFDGPGAEVRALTGAHTRVVWVQHDGKDPEAVGDQLVLMGFDTDDGKGERVILGERGSYVKPLLTPRGNRIMFSTRLKPGPAEVFIVNWDGTALRKLADGFALGLWENPADSGEWVYVGTENRNWEFATVSRFPIDAPDRREVVWNTTLVSMDNFPGVGRRPARRRPVSLAGGGRRRPAEPDGEEAGRGLLAGADQRPRTAFLVFRRRAPQRDDGRRRDRGAVDGEHQQRARI
jgi:hypothetical protein